MFGVIVAFILGAAAGVLVCLWIFQDLLATWFEVTNEHLRDMRTTLDTVGKHTHDYPYELQGNTDRYLNIVKSHRNDVVNVVREESSRIANLIREQNISSNDK